MSKAERLTQSIKSGFIDPDFLEIKRTKKMSDEHFYDFIIFSCGLHGAESFTKAQIESAIAYTEGLEKNIGQGTMQSLLKIKQEKGMSDDEFRVFLHGFISDICDESIPKSIDINEKTGEITLSIGDN